MRVTREAWQVTLLDNQRATGEAALAIRITFSLWPFRMECSGEDGGSLQSYLEQKERSQWFTEKVQEKKSPDTPLVLHGKPDLCCGDFLAYPLG